MTISSLIFSGTGCTLSLFFSFFFFWFYLLFEQKTRHIGVLAHLQKGLLLT